ncbi:MAG: sigma-54 dependent transcriptional regulator [Ignavibacteriaceae bacterium]
MTDIKKSKAKILVVDDDPKILYAFLEVLKKDGYSAVTAGDGEEALRTASLENIDLIFMDITLPKLDGLAVLKKFRELGISIPTVIITGYGIMQNAIKAMQLGAFDYLTKPLDIQKIREITQKVFPKSSDTNTIKENHPSLNADIVDRYDLIGGSAEMQEIYKLIGLVSTTPNTVSVLITGESGTGKELVARSIHNSTLGTGYPFIGINCSAVPDNLLESELFGYEKGAFTGAIDRKLGKFELAQNGTIFLDEIGNLFSNLQQKLLRVLQEREFERLGGGTSIKIQARFIAATNQNLELEIKKGNFREDLFFRLNVVSIKLPPLRERTEDIPLLANYFLAKYNEHLNKKVRGFSSRAMNLLGSYQFPGNVRELENLIERAVMLARGDEITHDLLEKMLSLNSIKIAAFPIVGTTFKQSREHILRMFEKQFVEEKLSSHSGNVTSAAKSSNMTRQNFQRMMKKYNIKAEEFKKK